MDVGGHHDNPGVRRRRTGVVPGSGVRRIFVDSGDFPDGAVYQRGARDTPVATTGEAYYIHHRERR